MTLQELNALLKTTTYPVAYSHFCTELSIPSICYIETEAEFTGADLKVLLQDVSYNIELYTDKKDLIAEGKVEKLLIDNNIKFSKNTSYIDTEKLYQTVYSVHFFKTI